MTKTELKKKLKSINMHKHLRSTYDVSFKEHTHNGTLFTVVHLIDGVDVSTFRYQNHKLCFVQGNTSVSLYDIETMKELFADE